MPAELRRVLHVDDNAGDRLLVSMALAALGDGFILQSAESGQAALDLLGVGTAGEVPLAPPDLLIVDINMPGMNGFEFVGKLTGHSKFVGANILFLSTSRAPADVLRASGHCSSLFAVKPLRFEDLCATLDIALRGFAGELQLPSGVDEIGNDNGILILRN